MNNKKPHQRLSITDLEVLDQKILFDLCRQESIERLACYRLIGSGATLAIDTGESGSHPLPVHFSCLSYHDTAKSKTLLVSGWQLLTDQLSKDYTELRGWKAYFPVQDLWSSQFVFLIKKDGRRAGKPNALDGFLEALGRRLHHWLATDEMRHFIDDSVSQEHTNAFGGMLSQILSHEMRNPLANLLSLVQTREIMQLESTQDEKEFSSEVGRFSRQIWDIVQKIELLTDVESNAFQNHEKPESLNIQSLVKLLIESESKHHADMPAKIMLSQSPDPIVVHGVPSLLNLCIREIIKNAYEFGNGTNIKIGCFQSGNNFILDIEDDGMPIPPGQEEMIFLRYFQGSRAPRSKTPMRRGLGLGLFLARFVTSLHAGQLLFVRGGPDRKGVFRMILPIHNSEGESSKTESPKGELKAS